MSPDCDPAWPGLIAGRLLFAEMLPIGSKADMKFSCLHFRQLLPLAPPARVPEFVDFPHPIMLKLQSKPARFLGGAGLMFLSV